MNSKLDFSQPITMKQFADQVVDPISLTNDSIKLQKVRNDMCVV